MGAILGQPKMADGVTVPCWTYSFVLHSAEVADLFDIDALDEDDPFEIGSDVLVVPLAPLGSGEAKQCQPVGCYMAATHLADRYREDR